MYQALYSSPAKAKQGGSAMSDYRVTSSENQVYHSASTGSVNPAPAGAPAVPPQDQEVSSVQAAKNEHAIVLQQQQQRQQQAKLSSQESDKASLPITNNSNVFLKFKVDENSSNITVYVVDRETKRILRSIPPEDMNKLQTGDLLELIA
jgi:uncharacterized FlaG/YvyC family protein